MSLARQPMARALHVGPCPGRMERPPCHPAAQSACCHALGSSALWGPALPAEGSGLRGAGRRVSPGAYHFTV